MKRSKQGKVGQGRRKRRKKRRKTFIICWVPVVITVNLHLIISVMQ